ncbi:MAG: DNA-3-methyladenine glycosylase [Bacteriovoracaceae bacterium]|nr:DNA-3-methyladenine glycosylase [Bacteriovoracaceae bacterium]
MILRAKEGYYRHPTSPEKILRNFYLRDAKTVAIDLLGKILVHRNKGREFRAKIVETEAYLGPHDLAAHSRMGKTKRNEIMFGEGGFAYIFLIYGIYDMFNIVVSEHNDAQAVLIRAGEPLEDPDRRLSGPGKFAQGMHITRRQNGVDLCGDQLFLIDGAPPKKIKKAKRIGVDYAGHWKDRHLRFYDAASEFVSVS